MKNLTNNFVEYLENDEFKRRMDAYARILKTNEWKFFRDALWNIKGEMAIDMFSQKFNSLSPEEIVARHEAYFQINQLLEFLLDPIKWARAKTLKQKLYDLKTKVNPKEKGEKK